MTATHEAVKTRHKETSLIFPVLALAVLLFWEAVSHCQWLWGSIFWLWWVF